MQYGLGAAGSEPPVAQRDVASMPVDASLTDRLPACVQRHRYCDLGSEFASRKARERR
jgi:hypothetical protein